MKIRVLLLLQQIDRAINELGEANFPSTKAQVARLIKMVRGDGWSTLEQLRGNIDLSARLTDELTAKALFVLTTEERARYECKEPIFGQKVNARFPEVAHQLEEAGKCYALERYTAGVFHLMCALQAPLNALAHKLRVRKSTVWSEWGTVIENIEQAIDALPRRTTRERAKRERYKQIVEHISIIKDARRNPTMHGRASCSPDDARFIWNGVEAFFCRVADDLFKWKI